MTSNESFRHLVEQQRLGIDQYEALRLKHERCQAALEALRRAVEDCWSGRAIGATVIDATAYIEGPLLEARKTTDAGENLLDLLAWHRQEDQRLRAAVVALEKVYEAAKEYTEMYVGGRTRVSRELRDAIAAVKDVPPYRSLEQWKAEREGR